MRNADTYAERKAGGQENEPLAILNFDYEGNISTFSPELLTMTHPQYGHFKFGNVFGGTLEEMLTAQKFGDMNAHIQRGVSRCRASCQYFAFCRGGAPSNKLWENNAFDSTETMRCKLGKQAIVDAVLDHLESRSALSSAHNVSPLERSMRLREWVKGGVLSTAAVAFTFDGDDVDDDGNGWKKY
jgi:radical SAM protein with 4Fe4S-binding SPASM domain